MFCSVKINYLYLSILKLKIMNDNVIYLLNVLRNYFNDLNEKLLQLMNPYRDEDMQPEATAMKIRTLKKLKRFKP